jgi:hypothetical protein
MSSDQKIKELFKARETAQQNKCDELQKRLQMLMNDPKIHKGGIEYLTVKGLRSYPINCPNVDLYVKRYNEDNQRSKIVLDKSHGDISHIETRVDDSKKTLTYRIY